MNNPKDPKRNAMIEQAFLNLTQGGGQTQAEVEQLQAIIKELADKDPAAVARLIQEWLGQDQD